MHRTNIYRDTEQIALLDRLASAGGVSRAQVIRQLLDRALQGSPAVDSVAADLSALDATYGAAPGFADAPARADARAAHLSELWGTP